jgi:hypothetical protein
VIRWDLLPPSSGSKGINYADACLLAYCPTLIMWAVLPTATVVDNLMSNLYFFYFEGFRAINGCRNFYSLGTKPRLHSPIFYSPFTINLGRLYSPIYDLRSLLYSIAARSFPQTNSRACLTMLPSQVLCKPLQPVREHYDINTAGGTACRETCYQHNRPESNVAGFESYDNNSQCDY